MSEGGAAPRELHPEPPHEEEPHEEGGEEPWLIAYADLMTLLFGFFAMLFTYATFEEAEVVKMDKAVAKYFGGSYLSGAEKMGENIKFAWGKTPYMNDMDLKVVEDGLEITFITSVLFGSGNADLLQGAQKPMAVLIDLIHGSTKEDISIRVEGHTDDNPTSTAKYPSNWELSAARAATIVRLFEKAGFRPETLGATGFGAAHPAFPNRDEQGNPIEENQTHNRRVVIKVILPKGMKAIDNIKTTEDAPIIPKTQ